MFCSHNDSPSLFEQTVRDTDEEFYATFPEAREALTRTFTDNVDLHSYDVTSYFLPEPRFSYQYSLTPPIIAQSPISLTPFASAGPSVSNVLGNPDTLIAPIHRRHKSRQPPTPKFTNGCELSVTHLDDFSGPLSLPASGGTQINFFHTNQRRSHLPSHALTWDSVPNSSKLSIRLSPLPNKRRLEKKPPLACLFCRGRKIACGPALPGSPNKTCNQCQRRSLRCQYPSESRRGMRKKKSSAAAEPATPHT